MLCWAATPKEVGDLRRIAGSAYVNYIRARNGFIVALIDSSSLIFQCRMVHSSFF
jgi:hypothetical protein